MKTEIIEKFESLGEKAFRFLNGEEDYMKLIEGLDKLLSFYQQLDEFSNLSNKVKNITIKDNISQVLEGMKTVKLEDKVPDKTIIFLENNK